LGDPLEFLLRCNVSKESIENAYEMYNEKYERRTDKERFSKLKINVKEKNGLWRLWVLALFYQVVSEEASERAFINLPKDSMVFEPRKIVEITLDCGCSYLRNEHRVHFCTFQQLKGLSSCKQNLFYQKCPFHKLSNLSDFRHFGKPRILRGLISTAIFLKKYDFDFQKYYDSLISLNSSEMTSTMLDTFTIISGSEKISHMFLAWLSNPEHYDIWKLDYKRLLAIDRNIIRVARNVGLCNTNNVNTIRAHLFKLVENIKVNPKVLELALLNIGQSYCKEEAQLCNECPWANKFSF